MEAARIDVTWVAATWSSWFRYQRGVNVTDTAITEIWRNATPADAGASVSASTPLRTSR